ncbi:MAG: aspartate carbamoyltransferase [Micavibrio sp.]|nr:MAG: aspartate carbamoyltransferase [Micavibrio sp.]
MQHLLGIEDLSADDIRNILDRAAYYAKALEGGKWDHKTLDDKIIITLFFEPSTRTLISFDIAAKRLGANVVNWQVENSAMRKDESFLDTILTLNQMRPDAIIIRHVEFGAPNFVATRVDCPVINGGDSWREHPTQALLDALTMEREIGKLEDLTVAICGDVAHSRVANSNAILLKKMGANVRIVAPEFLMPEKFAVEGLETFTSLEEGLPGADAVMLLRIQKERMEAGQIPDDAAYHNEFGLTLEQLNLAGPKAFVMHPGPMNRGVEISDELAEDPERSLIARQVANGIPTRMAVLDMLIGG